MKVFLIILIFAFLALLEIPGLMCKKQWRELAISSVLLGIGFLLSFLQVIGVSIPNPNKGLIYLIKLVVP